MNREDRFTNFWGLIRRAHAFAALVCIGITAPLPEAFAFEANLPQVSRAYEFPSGLELITAKGTGRTTGHIATITVRNTVDEPVELPSAMFYIPSGGTYQGYVGRPAPGHVVAPGATQDVPVEGYCSSVRLPPVPAGESLPPPDAWIVSTGETGPVEIPALDDPAAPGQALVPGTDTPLPRAVSVDGEPMVAVPLLLAAIGEIERATDELQESGALQTPFSANPGREREAVIQQTFWIFAAELENEEPYTREEFTERLEAQYESSTGVPIADAPEEDQQQLAKGADDFWSAFELVGAEAKVINVRGASAGGAPLGQPTAEVDGPVAAPGGLGGGPAAAAAPANCSVDKKITHSPRAVQVRIGENYGNEEERKKITEGITNAVESQENAYATSTPPSTAYSIWRDDHIGGISSGYAKVVFLEANDQEWVWSTEPLSTSASGNGVHTLAFKHGPECTAVVAGAASMWLKGSSEAFDPLERSIEYFRAVDAVKEVTVKYLAKKLPPGLSDGLEAGVEAITDPSSDTYAAASGSATLVVGADRDAKTATNRVVYKRKDKEDKAIIGGGETIEKIDVADQKPDSLTSHIDANVTMEAGAQGNGFAKAYLESLYGTMLVGVCECPDGILFDMLWENGQFIRSEGAKAAVERASKEMQEAEDRIKRDIESGEQEIDGESLERRVEAELARWAKSLGGDRFEPKEEEAASE